MLQCVQKKWPQNTLEIIENKIEISKKRYVPPE